MQRIQSAILPGLIIGILVLVALVGLISSPIEIVQAADIAAETPTVRTDKKAVVAYPVKPTPTKKVKKTPAAKNNKTAAEAQPDSSSCLVSDAYPDSIRQWCELITRHAGEHNLDANLVAALILQESGGDANAYSSAGAVGLMQVMPRDGIAATFQCASGPCFARRPSMDELYDPDFNISYGTRMLEGLNVRHGNIREALRAYGPSDYGYIYADKVLAIYERYR